MIDFPSFKRPAKICRKVMIEDILWLDTPWVMWILGRELQQQLSYASHSSSKSVDRVSSSPRREVPPLCENMSNFCPVWESRWLEVRFFQFCKKLSTLFFDKAKLENNQARYLYIDDGFLSSKKTEYFWWICHSVVPRGKQIRPGIMRINNVGAKKIKLEIRQAATSVGKRKWRLKSRLVKWASSYYLLLHLVVLYKIS